MTSSKTLIKLAHPMFLLSVALLIANDHFFKPAFHNQLTGKLSDFTGLIVLPYLLSVLISERKRGIHLAIGILFIVWKSDLSQPLIDFLNALDLPFNRTVDATDNIALLSLPVSLHLLKQDLHLFETRPALISILVLSSVSCVATSIHPKQLKLYSNINKDYQFEISKHELVSRLNAIQLKEIYALSKTTSLIDFDSERKVFHFHGAADTLALILDYTKINESDTIRYKTAYADIMIFGNETKSTLKLISINMPVLLTTEKDYREKVIKLFEKRVVKEIKKTAR